MKKSLLFFGLLFLVFSSCKKDSFNPIQQAATDDATIQAYMKANNITGTRDTSGLYYEVVTPGTGDYPDINSTVTVNSTGKLLNGTVFDTESGLNIALTNVIKGWQIGIPHINTGGRILLLIPSVLGYGDTANGSIPKNSVLIFTIDLLGFNN
jgi:FKBP-type peptidyl-prolyl cis-trans isomerase